MAKVGLPATSSLCLMGSWGRLEVVDGSDDDWLLLVEDETVDVAVLAEIANALTARPGVEGVFGKAASARHLIDRIGLDRDDNKNLTRRILLLLESQPLTGAAFYDRVRAELIGGYVNEWVGDRTVPRFFLNDVVRYWRTICVDFAGKERERGGAGWGLRNAKLRNSRKILFASGLLPLLLCERFGRADMARFLADQFSAPATSRVAYAFLVRGPGGLGGARPRRLRPVPRHPRGRDVPRPSRGAAPGGREALADVHGRAPRRGDAAGRAAGAAVRDAAVHAGRARRTRCSNRRTR